MSFKSSPNVPLHQAEKKYLTIMPCLLVLQSFYFPVYKEGPYRSHKFCCPIANTDSQLPPYCRFLGKPQDLLHLLPSGALLLPTTMPTPRNAILPRTPAPLPSVG